MTIRILCAVLSLVSAAIGQEASSPAATQPAESAGEKPAVQSIIQKLPDYSGDIWHSEFMTGDWGGARTKLAENGILFDLSATQILQGNAHGGKDTNNAFRYSGSADYTLKLDTARMGLWPGGLITLRGETQFGQSIRGKTGAIMAPNMDALLPVPDDSGITTLSEFTIMQALSEKLVLAAGKMDLTTGDGNVFAHDERTQFLNAAFRVNPILFPAGPYTTMAAGVILLPTKWLTITTFVNDNDPDGAATMTGFNPAFHGRDWLSVAQEFDFTWKPFGLEGHQRFGWFYTTRDFTLLEQDLRINLPAIPFRKPILRSRPLLRAARLAGVVRNFDPEKRPDDWGIYYNFDQFLYTKPDDPTQGFGIFGRFGWSNGNSNPIEQFYSLGLGGKGLVPERPKDTYGVGYYLVNLSNDLPSILNTSDEQGIEAYYNIEVTPWLHISPDLQVIVRPGGGFRDRDTAIAYGLRMQMSF